MCLFPSLFSFHTLPFYVFYHVLTCTLTLSFHKTEMIFQMLIGSFVVPGLSLLHATFWKCTHGSGFNFPPMLPFFIFLNQSIFMFPLSFSSSSSLSSTPPSLDLISEFDHGLSDISEDDDLVVNASASHAQWSLPSDTPTSFSDQLLADLERLLNDPPTFHPIAGSQINSLEVLGVEEGCQGKTRATARVPNWPSWFSLRAVVTRVSLFLCSFSLLGKNLYNCLTTKLQAGVIKLSLFTDTVSKLTSCRRSAGQLKIIINRSPKLITDHEFHLIQNYVALKWAHLVAFITSYVPPKCSSSVPAGLWKQTRLIWTSPMVSSLSSLPTKVFSFPSSSFLALYPLSPSCLLTPVHRYLRNPSPLLLPCLLILFLLVVMLTASQSLVLALILATPLGLTLCYLENVASSQRRPAVLPMCVSETASDQTSSGFSAKALCQKLKHSPHIRHQVHKSTNWTQEMCDPAA